VSERKEERPVIYSIGHSTLALQGFIETLKAHGITLVADVRSVPGSRHNPQFNREALSRSLKAESLEYLHMPGLGGFRKPAPDSINTGWKNDAFRGYADYMQTDEFEDNLAELTGLAKTETVTVMCSEAVPWRCHRSLLADALLFRGFEVVHIMSSGSGFSHKVTSFAAVDEGRITYPADQERMV